MGENQTVIVAIPAQNDYVWNISSQKVPHLTLLYLGDALSTPEDYQTAVQFLEHVSKSTITRFGLSVDHRDTLGPEDADVLFFKGEHTVKKLEDLRHSLRQNDVISKAYNATEQFPNWIPHLTLGYPTDPVKEDNRDYPGIHWVEFDRIALWTGDFDGPEFWLKDREDIEVAMSDGISSFLAHFGVRGMKWGVRRSDAQLARAGGSSKNEQDSNTALAEFIKANTSGPHGLSDNEVRDLITRAQLLKQYDEIFNKPAPPNAELAAKVAALELAARERQAEANISSAKHKKVNNLIKTSANSFEAYKKLDDATNGKLNKEISKVFKTAKKAQKATT